jgi:hypothetical protein
MNKEANKIIEKHGQSDLPDPALLLLLSNQVQPNSNVIAVQRVLQAPFSIDILYQDLSYPSPLDCEPPGTAENRLNSSQPSRSLQAWKPSQQHTTSNSTTHSI